MESGEQDFIRVYKAENGFQNQGAKIYTYGMVVKIKGTKIILRKWSKKSGGQNLYLGIGHKNPGDKIYTYRLVVKIRGTKITLRKWSYTIRRPEFTIYVTGGGGPTQHSKKMVITS